MKIAFVHPDLGIGGAERLVVDAAVGLQNLGHEVIVYTSYRDKNHCFDEARDGTLNVRVRGDTFFPANIGGRFAILCAMLRQIHLAVTLIRDKEEFDAIFIDQLSTAIPLFRILLPATRILFYCHFPDKLLSKRTSLLKSVYRIPFDLIEEITTGQADTIVVNSKFTASIFAKAFARLSTIPKVLYPCVDVHQAFSKKAIKTDRKLVLSINRFERKKDLGLAIASYSQLRGQQGFGEALLVIAGGYDERVAENVGYHKELQSMCAASSLTHKTLRTPYMLPLSFDEETHVYFLLSIPAELKTSLLASAEILLYTPMHEHFGIVPIEASLAGTLVLAQDNGGPLETVEDEVTGFLRAADPDLWSKVLDKVLFKMTSAERQNMGQQGRQKVITSFSQERMSETLEQELQQMQRQSRPASNPYAMALLALFLFALWKWALQPLISFT